MEVKGFLSKRMLATVRMVSAQRSVADVGCDHAYNSIYLVQQKQPLRVIATDINEGPLKRAADNVARFGVADRVELRLCDGLAGVEPGEVDTALIAGMGGRLMVTILSNRPEVLAGITELVLQPQSDRECVRRYLRENGFVITDEDMVWEEGKFYAMFRAVRATAECGTEKMPPSNAAVVPQVLADRFGALLLTGRHPVLKEFLTQELAKCELRLDGMEGTEHPRSKERAREMRLEKQAMEEALQYYAL